MKKISFLMLFSVLSLCLCACETTSESSNSLNNTTSESSSFDKPTSESSSLNVTTSEINPLDGFKVTSVAGVEVKDDYVTLTQAQYDDLILSPKEKCEYTLPNEVDVVVSVKENQLIFDLTSSSGNTAKYIITLNVLSNLADIDVKKVYNKQVIDDKVTFTESEYAAFLNLQDYDSVCEYQSSKGSTVQVNFDKQTHSLIFNVLSQDETKTNKVKIEVNVALPFSTHSLTGSGDKKYVTYDYENLLYSLTWICNSH